MRLYLVERSLLRAV